MSRPQTLLAAGERLDDLRRGGLKIIQNPAAPCFALDAVLLADFCCPQAGDTVAELGTGTGIIPLLLAAKQPLCRIRAVELMPQMAQMAERSVALNSLQQQIEIVRGDMRQADVLLGKGSCQAVVSNPPYYAAGQGRINRDELQAAARSELYCSIAELARSTAALLVPGGSLYLIHRAVRFVDVISAVLAEGLRPQTIRMVQPFTQKPAKLFLLQAVKGGKGESTLLPPLIVYDAPGIYSKEIATIYGC